MHVGCCENCRHIDLVEDHPDGCPMCGGRLVSLCVDSVHWNRMNNAGKRMLMMHILTEPKLRPETAPDFDLDPNSKEAVISELVKKADDRDIQFRYAKNEVNESRMTEESVEKARQELVRSVIKEKNARQKYVFICSKCNRVSAHLRHKGDYCCTECGSLMIDSGYKVNTWTSLTKDKKRKIISEVQLKNIIKAIRISDRA